MILVCLIGLFGRFSESMGRYEKDEQIGWGYCPKRSQNARRLYLLVFFDLYLGKVWPKSALGFDKKGASHRFFFGQNVHKKIQRGLVAVTYPWKIENK